MSAVTVEILGQKSYPKDSGTVPLSVVLRELRNGQFATHLRDDSLPEGCGYFWGHYFDDPYRAVSDYQERELAMDAQYQRRGFNV